MLSQSERQEFEGAPRETVLDEFSLDQSPIRPGGRARIRRYCPDDREAVRRICCDTAFLGNPIDAIFQDRKLYADLLTNPYLDHEPQWALVAEAEGRVVGYLLGSVCRRFELVLMRSGFRTACRMLFKVATGRYAHHSRSEQFVRWVLFAGFRERPKHPPHAAHLHINLERPYRGRAIGPHLWATYEQMLRSAEIESCYGEFYSYRKRRPESAYTRYGFTVFGRRQTTLFQPEIAETLDVVCAHKWLTAGLNSRRDGPNA